VAVLCMRNASGHNYRNSSFIVELAMAQIPRSALSRISPRVRVRDSVSIVYRIAPGGYSWIWPHVPQNVFLVFRMLLSPALIAGHFSCGAVDSP